MISDVIWHDIECGRYRQDLGLWLDLARNTPGEGALLDVGAGTGRVTLALARAGHRVVALDESPELLAELGRRAGGLAVETVCADARGFSLGRRFRLIVVPMQTLQLLGGPAGRAAFLVCARAHLAQAGLVAVAIAAAADFEEFEWRDGDGSPLPDTAELEGCAYFSQPTAVRRVPEGFLLERRRDVVDAGGARVTSHDVIRLEDVTVAKLTEAAGAAGLRLRGRRVIAATDEHIGSEVVIFGV